MMKLVMTFALVSAGAFAETWTGTVSDAHCGAKHADASEKSAACARKCVGGGAAAVFVTADGKVLQVANQDKVKEHVGHKVALAGSLKGDSVTVESVKMADAQ